MVGGAWEFGWEALVALGTLGLAVGTFVLALATRRLAVSTDKEVKAVGDELDLSRQTLAAVQEQAAAARDEVETSRLAAEATIRPVLVGARTAKAVRPDIGDVQTAYEPVAWPGTNETRNIPIGTATAWEDANTIYISVPLRNVGPGVALLRANALTLGDHRVSGVPSLGVVGPGETTRVQFNVARADDRSVALTEQSGSFSIEVAYTDAAGGQMSLTRADLQFDRAGLWYVSQVFLHRKVADRDGGIEWGDPVAASGAARDI
jgi:hypothetical protein